MLSYECVYECVNSTVSKYSTLDLRELSSAPQSYVFTLVLKKQVFIQKKTALPQSHSPIRGGLLGLKLLQCPPELELMTACSILVDGNGRRCSIKRQGRGCVSARCLFLCFIRSVVLPSGLFETPMSFLSLVPHMTCHPLNRPLTCVGHYRGKNSSFPLRSSAINNCFCPPPAVMLHNAQSRL